VWRLYAGPLLFLAGVTGFIVDARHRRNPGFEAFISSEPDVHKPHVSGLSPTVYDLIHVACWALVTAGVVVAIMGLIVYSARLRRPG
jgi:hypothetical protein